VGIWVGEGTGKLRKIGSRLGSGLYKICLLTPGAQRLQATIKPLKGCVPSTLGALEPDTDLLVGGCFVQPLPQYCQWAQCLHLWCHPLQLHLEVKSRRERWFPPQMASRQQVELHSLSSPLISSFPHMHGTLVIREGRTKPCPFTIRTFLLTHKTNQFWVHTSIPEKSSEQILLTFFKKAWIMPHPDHVTTFFS
jgi:hypothetical protein